MYKCFHCPGSLGFSGAKAQEAYNLTIRGTKREMARLRPANILRYFDQINSDFCHLKLKLLTCYSGLLENLNKCLSSQTTNSNFSSKCLTGPDMRNDDLVLDYVTSKILTGRKAKVAKGRDSN